MNNAGFLVGSTRNNLVSQFTSTVLVLLALVFVNGCSNLKLVTSYDDSLYKETVKVKNDVDGFYQTLLDDEQEKRQYDKFDQQYQKIELKIESLTELNKSKSENVESTKISQSILDLWKKYKGKHKLKDKYTTSNAQIDRNRFARLFGSAENAEAAKKRKKKKN